MEFAPKKTLADIELNSFDVNIDASEFGNLAYILESLGINGKINVRIQKIK